MSGLLNMLLSGNFAGNYALNIGTSVSGSNVYYGFSSGSAFGSITPTAFKAGNIIGVYDQYVSGVYASTYFYISGFLSDPGKTYFTTIATAGGLLTSASSSYGYSYGTAEWSWTSSPGLGIKNLGVGNVVPLNLV